MSDSYIPKVFNMSESQEVTFLQRQIIGEENTQLYDGHANYSGPQIRQAIVHTRQDIILLALELRRLNEKSLSMCKKSKWTNLWLFGLLAVMSFQTYLIMMQRAY